jgi:hypothetical protein
MKSVIRLPSGRVATVRAICPPPIREAARDTQTW